MLGTAGRREERVITSWKIVKPGAWMFGDIWVPRPTDCQCGAGSYSDQRDIEHSRFSCAHAKEEAEVPSTKDYPLLTQRKDETAPSSPENRLLLRAQIEKKKRQYHPPRRKEPLHTVHIPHPNLLQPNAKSHRTLYPSLQDQRQSQQESIKNQPTNHRNKIAKNPKC